MLKRVTILCLFVCFALSVRAQGTLVYHTSFEIDSSDYCRIDLPSQNRKLENFFDDVFTSQSTVDLYSYCDSLGFDYNLPLNFGGFQYPKDRNNHIGLIIASDTLNFPNLKNYREWVGINPQYEFKKNKFYKVELYISVGDNSGLFSIPPQVYFTADSMYYNSVEADFSIIDTSKIGIADTTILYSDTANWVKVSAIIKSNGEEKYIYLGNFLRPHLTKYEFAPEYIFDFSNPYSYFYIDDFSIYELDSVTSVIEDTQIENLNIYPNPAQDFVSIDIPVNYQNLQLSIFNLTGQLIAQKQITGSQQIPISELGNGMYIFVVESKGGIIGRKRVVVGR